MSDYLANLRGLQLEIELLAAEISERIQRFQKNKDSVDRLLQQGVPGGFLVEYLAELTAENRQLLDENQAALRRQSELIQKLVDELTTFKEMQAQVRESDAATSFLMTAGGMLPFNEAHPFFDQLPFLRKLLAHFEAEEQYEHCGPVHRRIRFLENRLVA